MRRWTVAVLVALSAASPAAAAPPWFGMPVSAWAPAIMPVQARGAAVDRLGQVLYVTDAADRVLEYSTVTGAYLGGWGSPGTGAGQFDSPQGIAVDPYGNVWVADTGNGRVQKFTAGGKPLLSFQIPQPIGVAAGVSELYVLTNLFRAVGVRSWAGKDLGAFVADFSRGFDSGAGGFYDPQPTTLDATAIASDPAGDAVVAGTVGQPLLKPGPACQSYDSSTALPPFPDPLVAPAVATFDDRGAVLRDSFPYYAGTICWTDSYDFWAYGASGAHSLGGAAVDPADGLSYTTAWQPYWVWNDRDAAGIWDPRFGPTLPTDGRSSGLYGPLRTFAIGCTSTLYLVTDQRIQAVPSARPATGACGVRSPLAEAPLRLFGARGGAPTPGKPSKQLEVTALCRSATACKRAVTVVVRPCKHCKALLSVRRPVVVRGGATRLLRWRLPRRVLRRLRARTPLTAALSAGRGTALRVPLTLPVRLSASCGTLRAAGTGVTIAGAVLPARRGQRVRLTVAGPDGEPLLLTATTDARGRYAARIPVPAAGVWTVAARLPAGRTRDTAQGSCGSIVGPTPMALTPPGPAGTGFESFDLALACPAAGTVGQPVAFTGTARPGSAGLPVALSVDGRPLPAAATADGGGFGGSFTPDAAGTRTVTAQLTLAGATLVRTCAVAVAPIATTLTLTCPSTAIPFPGTRTFAGTLSPAVAGATVTVSFGGQGTDAATGTVSASGDYSVDWSPPAPGQWTAKASWPGDAAHAAASSNECAVMVG